MASAVWKISRVIRKSCYTPSFRQAAISLTSRNSIHRCCPKLGSTEIMMPSLSPTMTEGTIVKWYKKEGDAVSPGDVLCDIQTDKAVVSLDTEDEGILAKILKPDNTSDIQVGVMIAIMVEEGDDWKNVEVPAQTEAPATPSAPATPTPQQAPPPSAAPSAPTGQAASPGDVHAHGIGPAVRKLMEEYGVPASDITGTGPLNRITKADVKKVISSKNLQRQDLSKATGPPTSTPQSSTPPATGGYNPLYDLDGEEYIDIPNTGMRTTIAKRLTLSKTTIPHSYVTIESKVGPVTALRKKMKEDGVKVSINDFIIKASALALQRVPAVNSVWQGEEATALFNVDVSVAVATESGLITPIVKNTAQLGVDEISAAVKDMAERARENKLQLHEFQGGTFTISNLGMFGISEFSAVINPPQTAIMAVGGSRVLLGEDRKPESRMTVCLSYDARVIDEGQASQFLEIFRDLMENPQLMLSGRAASKRTSLF